MGHTALFWLIAQVVGKERECTNHIAFMPAKQGPLPFLKRSEFHLLGSYTYSAGTHGRGRGRAMSLQQ